jgi:hypothetical protein
MITGTAERIRTAGPSSVRVTLPSPDRGLGLPLRRPTLKKSLRAIERAFADIAGIALALSDKLRLAERAADRKVKATGTPVRQLRITPKRRAQRKLQGAYMGYMRQLKPAQKLRVKAVIKVVRRTAIPR